MYDDDDNKTISAENLKKVAEELKENVPDHEIQLMLKIGDRNNRYGGEEVDFEDFMFIMQQTNLFSKKHDDSLMKSIVKKENGE